MTGQGAGSKKSHAVIIFLYANEKESVSLENFVSENELYLPRRVHKLEYSTVMCTDTNT